MHKLDPRDFPSWSAYYIGYQSALAEFWLIPLLEEWGRWREGLRVLDVGCGQAGASHALARAGARVDGVELEARLVGEARAAHRHERLRVFHGDITRPATLGELSEQYDLVLYRDVLEHIPDVDAALAESVRRLAPKAALLVLFPPYWSAFGGHQQTLRARRIGKLPFVHWLGPRIHRALAGISAGDPSWQDLQTVRRSRLTMGGMESIARRHGMRIVRRRDFLVRPSHQLRYGLPVVGAGWLARVPVLREFWVNGSYQLLVPERGFDGPPAAARAG